MDVVAEVGPEVIKREDIWAEVPEKDGTEIIIQRHEEYIRDKDDPRAGSLKEDVAVRSKEQTENVFREMLEQIPEEERGNIDVLVVASPTRYKGKGQRSMETAGEVLKGVSEVLEEFNLSSTQILNNQERLKLDGEPIPSKTIVEPKIFDDSWGFAQWLMNEYGNGEIGPDFFKAYELDKDEVKEKRLQEGAEGPFDIADRLAKFLYAMKLYSDKYHQKNPGKRLLIWTVSHYDTISPFVKSRIEGDRDRFLPVDYGGGIGINIKPDGNSSTRISGIDYPLPLVKNSTASATD